MSQTTESQAWTIKRLLEWTTEFLGSHGSESGRLDAEILLAESLGCQRIDLYTRYNEVPAGEPLTKYRGMVQRRAEGAPVAYLVGYREFFSLNFSVNESVLIPRPETEMLVIHALDLMKERTQSAESAQSAEKITLLDIGTGSGNISISIAKHSSTCEITAVDISEDALVVARKNAAGHEVDNRITFQQSDLFATIDPKNQFDFIVSNPPYIGTDETEVEADVKNYEPHVALFAGVDGMDTIVPLVNNAVQFLKPGGFLMFEISPFIATKCQELLESIEDFTEVQIVDDFANLSRLVIAKRK